VKTISEVSQLCTIALDQGKFVLWLNEGWNHWLGGWQWQEN
jgi:hypothetical protein